MVEASKVKARAHRIYRAALGRRFSRLASRWVDRVKPPQKSLLLVTAVIVGIVTGFAAVLFVKLILFIQGLSFESLPSYLPDLGRWWLIVIPALGGLLSGPIIAKFAQEAKGHGVPEVMQALALKGGRIRPRVALAKIVASSICLGTGGSAGREGPIVQVGSTFGSVLGQLLRLSESRNRNLVSCGAAAGVAATFNAPIAGVAFAIEVLAGDLALGVLGNVVIASVTASVISQWILGGHSAFEVPQYQLNSPLELIFYIGLGLLTAIVGIMFIKMLYASEDLFDRWKKPPNWLKPAIGGLGLGLLAFTYPHILVLMGVDAQNVGLSFPFMSGGENLAIPEVFSSGFETIGEALKGPSSILLLVSLLLLKSLATSLTLGSGNSGGVFAPSLFMGAMVGGAFGYAANHYFPTLAVHPGAYALCGMAGVFAASARAPLTAILIAFEMSDDYGLILPLMASTITATLAGQALHPESIYTKKLSRRGIRLQQGRDVDVLDAVLVKEIMDTQPATVSASMKLGDFERYLRDSHHHGVLVVDEQKNLVGILTLHDLHQAQESLGLGWQEAAVEVVMIRSLLTATPNETMGAALHRMGVRDIGRLPVVSQDNPQKIEGVIRRTDIARAYQRGLSRREDLQSRADQLKISQASGTIFLALVVEPESLAAGNPIRELHFPKNSLLTTRKRGELWQLLHGDDVLEVGDEVLALAEPESVEALKAMFTKSKS